METQRIFMGATRRKIVEEIGRTNASLPLRPKAVWGISPLGRQVAELLSGA